MAASISVSDLADLIKKADDLAIDGTISAAARAKFLNCGHTLRGDLVKLVAKQFDDTSKEYKDASGAISDANDKLDDAAKSIDDLNKALTAIGTVISTLASLLAMVP